VGVTVGKGVSVAVGGISVAEGSGARATFAMGTKVLVGFAGAKAAFVAVEERVAVGEVNPSPALHPQRRSNKLKQMKVEKKLNKVVKLSGALGAGKARAERPIPLIYLRSSSVTVTWAISAAIPTTK